MNYYEVTTSFMMCIEDPKSGRIKEKTQRDKYLVEAKSTNQANKIITEREAGFGLKDFKIISVKETKLTGIVLQKKDKKI